MTTSWQEWLDSLKSPRNGWNDIYAAHWGQGSWEGLDAPMTLDRNWRKKHKFSPDKIPRCIPNVDVEPLTYGKTLYVFRQYPYFVARILAVLDDPLFRTNVEIPPLVLTGTSGNGKSAFAIFFIIHLLRIQEQVIYYYLGCYYFFTEKGVKVSTVFPVMHLWRSIAQGQKLKFILDSDLENQPPLNVLDTKLFWIIQVSSPDQEQYRWCKQFSRRLFVMNPHYDRQLIRYITKFIQYTGESYTQQQIENAVRSFSPNMRTIWAGLREDSDAQIATIANAVQNLDETTFSRMLSGGDGDGVVRTVTVRPSPDPSDEKKYRSTEAMRHIIANQMVWRLLTVHYRKEHRTRLLEMIRRYSRIPPSKSYAGWLFESYAHDKLLEDGTHCLTRLTPEPSNPNYYSVPSNIKISTSIKSKSLTPRSFMSSDPVEDTSAKNTYYIPVQGNNPTFDAFMFARDKALAFQMTLAHSHSLKKIGLDKLRKRFNGYSDVNFVFVVPKNHRFRFKPGEHEFAQELTFWVYELDINSPDFEPVFGDWGDSERKEEQDYDDDTNQQDDE